MIYFDNAATSLIKPDTVSTAVKYAIDNFSNAGRGFYESSLNASSAVLEVRYKIAKLFNVQNPLDVAFTSNATESLNLVIDNFISENDHVITTIFEHNSVLRPLYKKKCELTIIDILNNKLNYLDFYNNYKKNTKAVVCTHASNFTGDFLNIKFIGDFCKKNNLVFILDVSQTAGFVNIDMIENNIDILCFTGHKSLLGPQGTGGICINNSKRFIIDPKKVGGSGNRSFSKTHSNIMPDCFEAGTINAHSIYGLSASLDYLNEISIQYIQKKELYLTWFFYKALRKINDVTIYGDFTTNIRCPIVSFNISNFSSDDVCLYLYEEGNIACRSGAHCAPLIHKHFDTIKQGAVRFSFSSFNTLKEVKTAISLLKKISAL